jgi:hypothetical protein
MRIVARAARNTQYMPSVPGRFDVDQEIKKTLIALPIFREINGNDFGDASNPSNGA